MKRSTFFLMTISFLVLLTGCKTEASTPNADHLADLDQQGIGMLRGTISTVPAAEGQPAQVLNVEVPVTMDGLAMTVSVPITLRNETLIASSLTEETDLLEYLSFHKGSSARDAFPKSALVEVTFRENITKFEALSVKEVKPGFFRRTPDEIEPMFSTDLFNPGLLQGRIVHSYKDSDGLLIWLVSLPIQMHDIQAALLVPVHAAGDTIVVTQGSTVLQLENVRGEVQIQFVRRNGILTARQVTQLR